MQKRLESLLYLRILESLEMFSLEMKSFAGKKHIMWTEQSRFILQALWEGLGQMDKITENELSF